jgi:N-acetylglucosamine kinase-like BadF-type ATPase
MSGARPLFLGVDGGGTKTAFVLADTQGRVLAQHHEGSLYHLEIGLDGVAATLRRGIDATLAQAGHGPDALRAAWVGLPAFGEDSRVQAHLASLPAQALPGVVVGCGNDMLCSWAGSLAGADGISLIAGTGSMTYGEFEGRRARIGGWGELFGDEGSAHWIAREGLALFSRMSDGRSARGPLHALVRERLALADDLDLCGRYLGEGGRSDVARFATLVHEAAVRGDAAARDVFDRAAGELARLVIATRRVLQVPGSRTLPVSWSGGVLDADGFTLAPLRARLAAEAGAFELRAPVMAPVLGAVWLAAREAGVPLDAQALARLAPPAAADVAGATLEARDTMPPSSSQP